MPKITPEDAPVIHGLLRERTFTELEMSERAYYRWRGGTIPREVAFLLNRPEIAFAVARESARLEALGQKVPESGDGE